MSETGKSVIELLKEAKGTLVNVASDVSRLHAKIDALPDSPEMAEIKQLASELNDSLKNVDAATPEDEVEGGGGSQEEQQQ